MKYSEVMALLNETGLSPEALVHYIPVSNSTYRRWIKTSPLEEFPKEYEVSVASGVYKLLNARVLSYDSSLVNAFLKNHLPEYFQAALKQLDGSSDIFPKNSSHQDKVMAVLSNLGSGAKVRTQVERSTKKIMKFSEFGSAWKQRISLLLKIIPSKEISLPEKAFSYGALFYLLWLFDLTPDTLPVFGFVDDFGVLGFAVAYYVKRFPQLAEGIELIG
jgi:uncharacterized membrane protein YkvA (DUF1232 family)